MTPFPYRSYYYDTETWFYYLQSRYYDPQICRFINADVLVSTGQGLLGNNMFAYCGNNPVMYVDPNGRFYIDWDLLPNQEAGETFGLWLMELTEEDKNAIQNGEVVYESRGADKGAHIDNSYKIKTIWVMFQFVEANRSDDIVGSTTGVVYEWIFHNFAYVVGSALDMSSISGPAADLDVGKTIYEDVRDPFTAKWVMSTAMKGSYIAVFPYFAVTDLVLGKWRESQNGK